MPGWYKAVADAPRWYDFLEERTQSAYANYGVFDGDRMVSLIAFSALGNDDYEAHLTSRRGVRADDLFGAMSTLRDGMFAAMGARMLIAKTADCNAGMRALLRRLGFAPTGSVERAGEHRQHVINIRLWRLTR